MRPREELKLIHISFLDLEKGFDRVFHEVVWFALRKHVILEELVD